MPGPSHSSESELIDAASRRLAAHVRGLRKRFPTALAMMRHDRQQAPPGLWPDWCWLPMASAATIVAEAGGPPDEFGRVAAVGQWRLAGQYVVLPSEDVASRAVPQRRTGNAEDPSAGMDVRLPRDALVEALSGACYYLVMPTGPDVVTGTAPQLWIYGAYAHLEHDMRTGAQELRLLADTGPTWEGLLPISVMLDQPTLAWSMATLSNNPVSRAMLGERFSARHAELARSLAWWVWPLLMTLTDPATYLIGPQPLPSQDVNVRAGKLWRLSDQPSRPTSVT